MRVAEPLPANAAAMPRRGFSQRDALVSGVVVLATLIVLVASTDDIVWGPYLPLLALAAFLGFLDSARLLRGKAGFMDPGALLGFLFLPMLLVAPVKQLAWDYWPFVPELTDSLRWIDLWAALNLAGMLLYRFGLRTRLRIRGEGMARAPRVWLPRSRRLFVFLLVAALLVGLAAQAYIYAHFGGIGGFVRTFTERQDAGAAEFDPFEGLGVPMILADSFKIMLSIALVHLFQDKPYARSMLFFVAMMGFLFVVFLLFGGLRGSRSATLFSLFCAAGLYHLKIRRLGLKVLALSLALSVGFMGAYYWYKTLGLEGFSASTGASARATLSDKRGSVGQYVVARDLGRMDVQVLALRDVNTDAGPGYALGRTYLASVFSIVPRSVVPFKPDQITREKTELIRGRGSYMPGEPRQTTLVLGQFGEAFVNFSYPGVLLFYLLLGVLVRRIRTLATTLDRADLRLYLVPGLVLIPILMVITDMNVIFQQLVRYLLVPSLVVLAATTRIRRPPERLP